MPNTTTRWIYREPLIEGDMKLENVDISYLYHIQSVPPFRMGGPKFWKFQKRGKLKKKILELGVFIIGPQIIVFQDSILCSRYILDLGAHLKSKAIFMWEGW